MTKRYILVELDTSGMDSDIEWLEEVNDALYIETPLGRADIRVADVTDLVETDEVTIYTRSRLQ